MGTPFSEIASHYGRIEDLSGRLEMTDELIDLLKDRSPSDIEMIIRLTKGEVKPGYEGLELGVAEKLAMKALYMVTMVPFHEIEDLSKKKGDIGLLAEAIIGSKKQMSLFQEPLTLDRVFGNLEKIARAGGRSSQDLKLKLIAEMLHDSTPLEARYITRILCGKMRLGIADMTVIDALSYLFTPGFEEAGSLLEGLEGIEGFRNEIRNIGTKRTGPLYELIYVSSKPDKNNLSRETAKMMTEILEKLKGKVNENREKLARTFNVHPDLGSIGRMLGEEGMDVVLEIGVRPGIPLRSMLGERLSSVEEILDKMGGTSAFEYKYDGLRVQVHLFNENGNTKIKLFSRQLEDITHQFPDVRSSLESSFKGIDCIVEGECVPVDPDTGAFLPFQIISQRRGRKYGLDEKIEEVPVSLVMFDCLFKNGEDMTNQPYLSRRKAITELFTGIDQEIDLERGLSLSTMEVITDPEVGNTFFEKALEDGCEGIMAKNISDSSIYQAGSRGWLWVKYKNDYRSELSDTLDLVVVGAFYGTGRRKGTYGALLMATWDEKESIFRTVCKLGSGFNDEHLAYLIGQVDEMKGDKVSVWKNVRSQIEPDVYTSPELVLEVLAAEITFSPIHTCSFNILKEGAGLGLRFPRFTGRFRKDKGPTDATTDDEVVSMYSSQKKTFS